MCDYSLHLIASRPAKVADRLVSTDFATSITRGFTEIGQPGVAVCLLPGTEIAFDDAVQSTTAPSACSARRASSTASRAFVRSIWTIRTSITTRWNFRAARS